MYNKFFGSIFNKFVYCKILGLIFLGLVSCSEKEQPYKPEFSINECVLSHEYEFSSKFKDDYKKITKVGRYNYEYQYLGVYSGKKETKEEFILKFDHENNSIPCPKFLE